MERAHKKFSNKNWQKIDNVLGPFFASRKLLEVAIAKMVKHQKANSFALICHEGCSAEKLHS